MSQITLTNQLVTSLRNQLHPSLSKAGSSIAGRAGGGDEWYLVLGSAFASAHKGAEALPLLYDMAVQGGEDGVRVQRRLKETVLKVR